VKSNSNQSKPTIKKVIASEEHTSKAYMVAWRAENKERIKAINHRYYMRNKGFLNKTRSRPWNKENILRWIMNGEKKYLDIMMRILRPHKDRLIGLNNNENEANK